MFDPHRANLSGMSDDPELYVRNIEQSVAVVIRNYVKILDIQTSKSRYNFLNEVFSATAHYSRYLHNYNKMFCV